jgi:hypothetical protein
MEVGARFVANKLGPPWRARFSMAVRLNRRARQNLHRTDLRARKILKRAFAGKKPASSASASPRKFSFLGFSCLFWPHQLSNGHVSKIEAPAPSCMGEAAKQGKERE